MSWKVEYLPEAEKDLKGLDGSQRNLVLKAIKKVQQNPLPVDENGYGKPLGNHNSTSLAGLMKIIHPHIFLPGITLTEKVMPPPERKNQPIHLRGSGLFLLMSLNPPAGDLPPAPLCQKETPWVNLVHSTGNPVQIGGLKHGANPHQSGRFPPVFLKLRHRVSMPKACRNRVFLPAWNRIPRVKTTG